MADKVGVDEARELAVDVIFRAFVFEAAQTGVEVAVGGEDSGELFAELGGGGDEVLFALC